MKRIYVIILSLLMLVPVVSGWHSHTHWLYMFTHVNVCHWLANAFFAILSYRLMSPKLLFIAYVFSVICSFVIPLNIPVEGFSVILFFLSGMVCAYTLKGLVYTMLFVAIGFFLPYIAASYHLFMFISGLSIGLSVKLYAAYKTYTR